MFDEMNDYEVIAHVSNGMEGFVWRENDGWYGEVADPEVYCQGAAWGVATREEAVAKVMQEVAQIEDMLAKGYYN